MATKATRFKRVRRRLIQHLREVGTSEANMLAGNIEADLVKDEVLEEMLRNVTALHGVATGALEGIEAKILPTALSAFHVAKQRAQADPSGKVSEAVRQMSRALRARQNRPRGRRGRANRGNPSYGG